MPTKSVSSLDATTAAVSGDYLRQFAVIVATLLTLAVNGLANALPLNGQTTGEVSDSFPVLFVPAGYVFSIWGVIYLGLLAYTVFQALPSQRTNPRLRAIGWWYVLGSLANSAWIFFWHYNQFPATMVMMVILLISLLVTYLRLSPARKQAGRSEWWSTHLPFSIYLGWITVATVANASTVLYDLGWNGGGIAPELWTVTMLVVAAVLGLLMQGRQADSAYVAVLIWAFVGITVKQSGAPLVAYSAAGLALFLALVAVAGTVRRPMWAR